MSRPKPPAVVVAVDFAPPPPVRDRRWLVLVAELVAGVAALGLAGFVTGMLLR